VTGQGAGTVWPSACPPAADVALSWTLSDVAELPGIRAEVRRLIPRLAHPRGPAGRDVLDQLVLALDEMASNALRHGRGSVQVVVQLTEDDYVVEVSDQAVGTPPTPAVDRDPSQGGLGLYLIAELASRHGWYVRGGRKHVWAVLPRR
jgi:anti-sigma regulatory factor (Ser/Thr protein kinase)